MTATPDQVLHDIASRVARRVASAGAAASALPAKYTLLALSGEGSGLASEIARLAASSDPLVAVADCPSGSAGAMATALARLPRVRAVAGEDAFADRVVAGAERVVAPSMDLALASRVASMQSDTPASRAILRALLRGVPVEASLDERDFSASALAPNGIRQALEDVVDRVRRLGVVVHGRPPDAAPTPPALASAATYGAGAPHPSQERFAVPEAVGEIVEFLENRPCSLETDKPCVKCGVCDSRGF